MIRFDDLGYITPYEVHELTLGEFERTFVIDSERERLFKALMNFVLDLKNLGAGEFYIWVDGSFATKKRIPGDIDLVAFLSEKPYQRITHQLALLSSQYKDNLDAFFVVEYPENHPDFNITIVQKMKWHELFGFDRQGNRKGLVNLNF